MVATIEKCLIDGFKPEGIEAVVSEPCVRQAGRAEFFAWWFPSSRQFPDILPNRLDRIWLSHRNVCRCVFVPGCGMVEPLGFRQTSVACGSWD